MPLTITEIHLTSHDAALVYFALNMAIVQARGAPKTMTALRALARKFAVGVRDCRTIGTRARVLVEILEQERGAADETKQGG